MAMTGYGSPLSRAKAAGATARTCPPNADCVAAIRP